MKKKMASFFTMLMTVVMLIGGTTTVNAYTGNVTIARSGVPTETTWVLNYKGRDFYIEADTLNIDHDKGIFSAVIIISYGEKQTDGYCEIARAWDGDTAMWWEGAWVKNQDLAKQLYDAIQNKFS